jgi:hypothetical protein
LACALVALIQLSWAGYQLGVGNQSIQVAFLWRRLDPTQFPRDEMVNTTLARYPSLFFHAAAQALRVVDVEHLYLALQLATVLGVFIALAALARAMFRDRWTGLVVAGLVLAGHHHALAEQTLYSNGFTHTWAVLPLTITALALLYAGRHWWAFGLTGALANLHALEAGYHGLALGIWALGNSRALGWRKVAGLLALMGALALPVVCLALRHPQSFDAHWLQMMHVRSALHSFPSAWWRPGNPDVPRFALLCGLAALAWSWRPPGTTARTTAWLAGAIGLLFVAGYVFTEIWPQPLVVRAQLFRASRLLLVLVLAQIAWGCVQARGPLEWLAAAVTFYAVAAPAATVLLPVALVLGTLVALINRRLHWAQAVAVGLALLVCLVAWRQIQFVVFGFSWSSLLAGRGPGWVGWLVIAAAGAVWYLAEQPLRRWQCASVAVAAAVSVIVLLVQLRPVLLTPSGADAAWQDAQRWARNHTRPDALFLTPAQVGGFRILSQRSVVGEWRDGTQLYFSAAFAKPWWDRMNALQPGLRLAPDGRRLLVRGKTLGQLEDEQVLALARQFDATHLVLPADETRRLAMLYTNTEWGIYLPNYAPATVQQEALLARQAKFLRDVAQPNIARHRQRDIQIQIVTTDGRPVYDASYRLTQTNSAFGFGVTVPATPTDEQARRVRELFNYTVVTTPAWWTSLEPQAGQRRYDALDQHLAWCRERGLAVEFSFLAGHEPRWLTASNRVAQLTAHMEDLLTRYTNSVACWQLTDQGVLLDAAANAWGAVREKFPGLRLGLSDTGRLNAPADFTEARTAPVEYIAWHARQPWGWWAEAAALYEMFDAAAKENRRVHLTGFYVPSEGWIEGPVRGGQWDAKLQAEYCRQFYTIAFSHPAVDVVNYAELTPGLVAADGKPRPVYTALRDLILKQWRTRQAGKLPLDGRVGLRAFHGDYELAITLKNGRTARAAFAVTQAGAGQFRFRVDAEKGTVELAP